MDAKGALVEGGEEEVWAGVDAGSVAGRDPGEVVDRLVLEAVEAVEDRGGGVGGCGGDGIDSWGAVGLGLVAGDGEVHSVIEVVATVWVDVAEGGEI